MAAPRSQPCQGDFHEIAQHPVSIHPVRASKDGAEWKTTFLDLQSTALIFGTTDCLACPAAVPPAPAYCSQGHVWAGDQVLTLPLVGLSGGRTSSSNPPPPMRREEALTRVGEAGTVG